MLTVTNHQKLQIKTTMRCQLTPLRMAITRKIKDNCWHGCEEGHPCVPSARRQISAIIKSSPEVNQEVTISVDIGPGNPTAGCIEMKSVC